MVERTKELPGASGVEFGQFPWLETGVGNVATASAGNFDFGEDFVGFFQDEDFGLGVYLSAGDGGEEACGSSADYDKVIVGHSVFFGRICTAGCAKESGSRLPQSKDVPSCGSCA